MRSDPIRILAISGSLRSVSSNSVLLRAAATLAPKQIQIFLYQGLGDLPHFNPDFDGDEPCAPVADFRNHLREADGVLISTPEYAHGVPGVLKNALDWLVRSGEFVDKPVCIINHLPRGEWAFASLKEILTVMTACLIEETSFTLPLPTNNIDEARILASEELSRTIYDGITRFAEAVQRRRTEVKREALLKAINNAVLNTAQKVVGPARGLRVEIDSQSGEIKAYAKLTVVEKVLIKHDQISFKLAKKFKKDVQLGEDLEVPVTPKGFGRIAAQTAKEAMMEHIRKAESE